ncbi:AraC family transcriptional regulator [Salmonella enterica]
MNEQWQTENLELITLNDAIVSFSRLFANTVRYHHWHQCLEVLYIEEGFGVVMVDNRQYTMRPGRLFFFPPFTIHKVMVAEQAQDCYRRTIIHVDNHAILKYLRDFPHNHDRFQRLALRGAPAVVMDVAAIHAHIDHLFSCYAKMASSNSLSGEQVTCLLLNLLSMLPEDDHKRPEARSGIATPVMFWLEENYRRKFSLERLAQASGKSRSYVSRRFHEETGEHIHQYLNTLRLRKACDLLLHSTLAIKHIASEVGFSDVTYFISAFKKGIGETPLQYRKSRMATLRHSPGRN